MANIKNFGIQGVGSDVQFGKAGNRLASNGSVFQVLTANGATLVRLQAAGPSSNNDVATKKYQDDAVSVINTAAGLAANSSYVANTSANYISGATSLTNADDLLDAALMSEANARTSNAAELYADIQQEISDRTSNAAELYTDIQNEISARTSNAAELYTDIQNETSARQSNAAELYGDIMDEQSRAQGAENAINTAISNETYRAQGAEFAINTAISAETTRAQAAEADINTAIQTETFRAQGAESAINSAIDAETLRATNAEQSLQSNITNEYNRASGAETAINTAITAETTRAQAAETDINTAITAETNRAQGAETAINTAITAETTRAQAAETDINTAITAETNRAEGAENAINTVITTLSGEVIYKNGNTAFTGDQSMGGNKLTVVGTPSVDGDAANKKYVDDEIAKLGQVFNFVGNISGGTQGSPTDMSNAGSGPSDRDAGSYYHVEAAGYFTFGATTIYAEALDAVVFNTSGGIDRIAHVDTIVNGTIGYVAVSGNIDTGFTVDIDTSFKDRMSNAESEISTLQTDLSNEITRAGAAETDINTAISNETIRAQGAETAINTAITAETNRAQGAESAINTAITAETNRAQGAETAINTAITAETNRAQAAETDINTAISNETYRAQAAETDINTAISNETYRAQGAESAINSAISAETLRATNAEISLQSNISAEVTRAQAAETDINTAISNETYRAQAAETAINTAITAETTRAQAAETDINTAISNETYRAQGAESAINTAISALTLDLNNEVTRAEAAESAINSVLNANDTRISNLESNSVQLFANVAAIEASVDLNSDGTIKNWVGSSQYIGGTTTFKAAVEALDSSLYTEVTARLSNAAELYGDIQQEISDRQTAVTNEYNRASAAELSINSALTDEYNRAVGAETAINTAITAETNRAQGAESAINTAITAETTRAQAAESDINTAISNETYRAEAAENDINTAITAETNRAEAAEMSLQGNITAEVNRAQAAESDINTAITAETNRAEAAETAINTAITAETNRAEGAEMAINTVISDLSGAVIYKNGNTAFTGDQSMGNYKLTNLSTPTTDYDASTKKYVDDAISSLGNVFNYVGTLVGEPTEGSPLNLSIQAHKKPGDYYHVITAGWFTFNGVTLYAEVDDAIVFNAQGTIDRIAHVDTVVTGSEAYISVTGTIDTGFTVDISSTFKDRMTQAESDIQTLMGEVSTLQGDVTTLQNDVTDLWTNAGYLAANTAAVESSVGLTGTAYVANATGHYISTANSVVNSIDLLDTELKSTNDTLALLHADYIYSGNNLFKVQTTNTAVEVYGDVGGVTGKIGEIVAGAGSNANFSLDLSGSGVVALNAGRRSGTSATDIALAPYNGGNVVINGGTVVGNAALTVAAGGTSDLTLKGGSTGHVNLVDGSGANVLVTGTGSATGYLTVDGGSAVTLSATGSGTDIDLVLAPKGAGNVDASNANIINVATPTTATDAANRGYVDDALENAFVGTVRSVSTAITETDGTVNIGTFKGTAVRVRVLLSSAFTAGTAITVGRTGAADELVTTGNIDEANAGLYIIDAMQNYSTNTTVTVTITGSGGGSGAGKVLVEYVQG